MTAPATTTGGSISGRWQLDTRRSNVRFTVRLPWGLTSVTGEFAEYRGRLDLGTDPAIELTIDAASLQTGNRRRDKHLRSSAFFNVDDHPHVQFLSDSVEPSRDGLKVRGRLSARGHSIPLELDVQVRHLNGELRIEVATTVPHRELGMTYSPLGMIPSHSDLSVTAYLVPDSSSHAAGHASITREPDRSVASGSYVSPQSRSLNRWPSAWPSSWHRQPRR